MEQYSRCITDPVLKFKFIQRVLDRYQKTTGLRKLPGLRAIKCRQIALEELNHLAASNPIDFNARWHTRLRVYPSQNMAIGLITAWLFVLLLAFYTSHALLQGASRRNSLRTVPPDVYNSVPTYGKLLAPARTHEPVTAHSDDHPTVVRSQGQIWLVEKQSGYEFYSNGLRILTEYETETVPREYGVFGRDGPLPSKVENRAVGLLYHTSEGEVFPFSSECNRLLTETARQLLTYVTRHKLYNYVIDRFGRVYRVVKDDHTAYHAGFSIWSHNDAIYIGLNQSFIGVCFEGRWSGQENAVPAKHRTRASTMTSAQIHAGRLLTDLLRQKYSIPDRNCVTHGLVSVNPKKFLIGHHVDWIRDFPFQELGLEDKYRLPLPSIAEFGFDYDDFFLTVIGEPPPGAELALKKLKERAAENNMSYESLRAKLHQDFERKLAWLKRSHGPARESADASNSSRVKESLNQP